MQKEKKLIEALHPSGDILEIGYRSDLAAAQIQKYHPKSHTIVDPDLSAAKKAKKWAEEHGAALIEESWESALPRLPVFDAIFFALPPAPELHRKGEEALLQSIEEELPQLTKIRYSDSDLEAFCEQGCRAAPEQVDRFLADLEKNGQIAEMQRDKMVRKFKLKGGKIPPPPKRTSPDLLPCLRQCLASHMRIGSRFSCFLEDGISKSEDPCFFKEIVVNPSVNCREWALQTPKGPQVLILLIEKLA